MAGIYSAAPAGAASTAGSGGGTPAPARTPEQKARDAYHAVAGGDNGSFVKVADVKDRMGPGMSEADKDTVLKRMYRSQQVNLTPNHRAPKYHAPDEKARAIRIGGEDKHLMSIRPRPAPGR